MDARMQCACDLQGDRDRYRQFYDERLALNTPLLCSTAKQSHEASLSLHICVYILAIISYVLLSGP